MLILTRRLGENVVVGDDIVISVLDIRGDAVRIGIQAPRSVSVHREEVYLELQRANQQAAQSGAAADDDVAAVARSLTADLPALRRAGSTAVRRSDDGRGATPRGRRPGGGSPAD